MKTLQKFVKEFHEKYIYEEVFDDTIEGEIKRVKKALLDEKFLPSVQLKNLFDKLLRRSQYPMEVAIVGQFSSGKSTFLNALLSKDILPTGITPVTSKVNFINYGSEYKLKVTYKNGANEYHALENIAKFTDQREVMQDVKYLTLYAPMEILKDISFVDTPGLNSQSHQDTETTKKILRDVDGIIWLTLIDNAGKESETQVLKEYLSNFNAKSLCVLNQKDKYTKEQVETTLSYMKESFSEYFAQVVPISAKEALDSRSNQKEVLLESALFNMQQRFKDMSSQHINAQNLDFFSQVYRSFQQEVQRIEKEDKSNDNALLKSSNISNVLEFIETSIRPQAKASKAFALRNDMRQVCDVLILEYETILAVYESLEEILRSKESELIQGYDELYLKHSKSLYSTADKIESIVQTIADTIYKNIKPIKAQRQKEEKNILGLVSLKTYEYDSLSVDSETIMQELFFQDQYIDKQIKATISYFKKIELDTSENFRDVFRILKVAVQTWQEPYELIKKQREIASDRMFADTRQFVAKVYENILLEYHRATLGNIRAIGKKSAYFNGALSFSYKQITQESIYFFQNRLQKQILMYEKDPLKYSISVPSSEIILEEVKKNFSYEKIEIFLNSRRNYLYKIIETSKEQFLVINKNEIDYVGVQKQNVVETLQSIQEIKESITS